MLGDLFSAKRADYLNPFTIKKQVGLEIWDSQLGWSSVFTESKAQTKGSAFSQQWGPVWSVFPPFFTWFFRGFHVAGPPTPPTIWGTSLSCRNSVQSRTKGIRDPLGIPPAKIWGVEASKNRDEGRATLEYIIIYIYIPKDPCMEYLPTSGLF